MKTVILAALTAIKAVFANDAFKTMDEIAKENGFITEHYTVETEDGYLLSLYRIPGSASEMEYGVKNAQKPAVLFMHA